MSIIRKGDQIPRDAIEKADGAGFSRPDIYDGTLEVKPKAKIVGIYGSLIGRAPSEEVSERCSSEGEPENAQKNLGRRVLDRLGL